MTKSIPSAFAINQYLWSKIQEEAILNPANYDGMVPIIPIQEEPEFLKAIEEQPGIGSHPYIVYSWYTNGIGPNDWYKQIDSLTYQVSSTDQKKLRELVLLITKLFKRYDESAQVVNRFVASHYPDETSAYRSYNYLHISIASVQAGTASDGENDPNVATINLRVAFTEDDNDLPLQ